MSNEELLWSYSVRLYDIGEMLNLSMMDSKNNHISMSIHIFQLLITENWCNIPPESGLTSLHNYWGNVVAFEETIQDFN